MPVAPGTLYLLPTPLAATELEAVLPAGVLARVRALRHFVAETPKQARQFLARADLPVPIQQISIAVLDEHTTHDHIPVLLEPLLAGNDVGLLSDAGCPAVADPGAELVRCAHERGIAVRPLVGPSSILLALMGSGLNGQRFTFHGYLPVDAQRRAQRIRELERESRERDATQIFIEAPYRNPRMLQALLEHCAADTRIGLATDLTDATESVRTRSVAQWRRQPPAIERRPTVFLLYAGARRAR
ncbi:MAG TPA: SAM-dependent methyltransferase [Burkholderiales bacterium]|nr:SAM-dependent methyltransferase [Burkholderiales bacterium]